MLGALPSEYGLLFAAIQGRSNLPYQPLHPADGEIDVDGNRHPDMLQHSFTFVGFGFEERLVDNDCGEFLCPQMPKRLTKRVGNLSGFFSRFVERFCAVLSSRRGRYEQNHGSLTSTRITTLLMPEHAVVTSAYA